MKDFVKRNRKVLVLACSLALFLVGAAAFQIVMNQLKPFEDVPVVNVENNEKEKTTEEIEVLHKPVGDDMKVVRGFYDTSLSDEELQNALIYFEGVYRPNYGVDYANDGKTFDVLAATSGTVTKKENDSLLGWIITIEHDSGVSTTYQSLSQVKVEKGDKVKQGDVIAVSGENVYESELKSHVHFILSKDNKTLNPETYYNQELTKIKS